MAKIQHPAFKDESPENLAKRIKIARRLCNDLNLSPYGHSIVGVPGDHESKSQPQVDRPFNLTICLMAVGLWNEAGKAIESEGRTVPAPEPQAAQTGD
jgi:DNA repair exonuclease SbcCD nuclease subunit